MRWVARIPVLSPIAGRCGVWVAALPLLAAACSHDPIQYIPQSDRTMLQAQERLGTGQGSGGPISVDEMLRRAKAGDQGKPVPSSVVIRFDGDSVQPDAAQRDTLRRFAMQAQAGGGAVTVASRPGSFEDTGAPVLGPRRAIAVSRELSSSVADVLMRFDPTLPPGVVIVSLGHPAAPEAASGAPAPEAALGTPAP